MEFDKLKVYTALNADEIKVGSKGYSADNIAELQRCVFNEDKDYFFTIKEIATEDENYRFLVADNYSGNETSWNLFYLVEKPKEKELRPYKDTDEMIDHFCRHFNLIPQDHRLPTLWVKNDNRKYLITRVSENTVTMCFENDVSTFSLRILFDDYTWLDGSPCGIEE